MTTRKIAVVVMGLACAGCASESNTRVLGFQGSAAYSPITTATAAPAPASGEMKRTMASKVLAAMALERVTGRKPDPARLASLD
jgi:hypothetical protein